MWCPNCKNEYREGVTVCPDCDVELVDELSEEEPAELNDPVPVNLMNATSPEIGDKVVRYMRYNGIVSGALIEDDGIYHVIVADFEEENALKLFPGLEPGDDVNDDRLYELVPDIEDQFEEIENEQASKEFSELRSEASTVYVKKRDKYADLRFSGFSFIGFGILGVIIIVLNAVGIISLFNTYSMIIMSLVFLTFFIIGFSTLFRASKVKEYVDVEDEFTKDLNAWIEENLSDEVIDEWYDENREDQENYFEIQGNLTSMLTEQFPNIHPSYIEELAEERYNSYLENSGYESTEDTYEPEESENVDSDEADDAEAVDEE